MDTYEKKYKNALTIAQSRFKIEKDESVLTCLGMMFPELRENEDERTRKELLDYVKYNKEHTPETVPGEHWDRWISYLEKQKEQKPRDYCSVRDEFDLDGNLKQKPAEWNDTDMKEARNDLISVCRDWEFGKQTTLLPIAAVRARYFLEHLTEPKPAEWSEEDETIIEGACSALEIHGHDKLASKLKSLRPNKQD